MLLLFSCYHWLYKIYSILKMDVILFSSIILLVNIFHFSKAAGPEKCRAILYESGSCEIVNDIGKTEFTITTGFDTSVSKVISVQFDKFDINPKQSVSNYILIYGNGDLIGNYSTKGPMGVTVTAKKPTVKFQMNYGDSVNHFKISYKAKPIDKLLKTETISDTEAGNITSPGYPLNYPAGIRKEYQITSSDSSGILKLEFIDFDLGPADSQAKLYIFEGVSSKTLQLYTFHGGSRHYGAYYTSGNAIFILFETELGFTYKGFKLKFTEYCEYKAGEVPCAQAHTKKALSHLLVVGVSCAAFIGVIGAIFLFCWLHRKCQQRNPPERFT